MITQMTLGNLEDLESWLAISEKGGLVCDAIVGFRAFALKYVEQVEELIETAHFDPTMTTKDRLKARLLEALNTYWVTLGEAAAQRLVRVYRDHLDIGDQKAQDLLRPWPKLKLAGTIVYFNKVPSVMYYPYTDIAFVGIPYTNIAGQDWMGIPHEVAHNVYWNLGKSLKEVREKHLQIEEGSRAGLRQALQHTQSDPKTSEAIENMLLSWVEEMFCDIFGTWIGGKDFVESLQNLIKSSASNVNDLTEDDRCHPPLCVRTYIREHAYRLRQGADDTPPVVDWDAFFRFFQCNNVGALKLESRLPSAQGDVSTVNVTVDEIWPAVKVVVELLAKEINSVLNDGLDAHTDPVRAVQQLFELAQEGAHTNFEILERLLTPRVLEGGYRDGPHRGVEVHGKPHYIGVHYHS